MRTFLLVGVLCFAGLTAQEPPPPAPLDLTPAEVELVRYYLDLRAVELRANPQAFGEIWRKYDDLVRRALPPEKYLLAQPLLGC
jgi:hypothetical protein